MSRPRLLAAALLASPLCATLPAWAQRSEKPVAPVFAFADVAQGSKILGARDDYVRATSPLERRAKLKTADPVDEEHFLRHMREAPLEWSAEQRDNLEPLFLTLG